MLSNLYITCPACFGAAYEWDDPRSDRHGQWCNRCNNNGVITEQDATPEEIEANRRSWEADARARNKVDYPCD